MRSDPAARPARHPLTTPFLVGTASILCALLVAGVGIAGGFDQVAVAPDGPPPAEVDEVVEGGPWEVTVIDAALYPGAALEPARLLDEDNHWLVVLAEVEITAGSTFPNISGALVAPGIDGLRDDGDDAQPPRPQVWRTRDNTRAHWLEPGLPERLLFLWERSGAAAPAEVQVDVIGATYRRSAVSAFEPLFGAHSEWLDFEPTARVVVPLKDRREDPELVGDG